MTIARHYVLDARDGQDAVAETLIGRLIDALSATEGCEGIDLLRDAGNAGRFVMLQRWTSIEAHKAAIGTIRRSQLAELIASLVAMPQGAYFDYLKRG